MMRASPRSGRSSSAGCRRASSVRSSMGRKHEGQQYTTAAMLRLERGAIGHMQEGNKRAYQDPMLVPANPGQTADRMLIHVDTELAAKDLINHRMAYVAVSRGAHDAQLFTNDREKLGIALGHDVSHRSAHAPEVKRSRRLRRSRSNLTSRTSILDSACKR